MKITYRSKNSAVQPVWDVEFSSPTLTIYTAIIGVLHCDHRRTTCGIVNRIFY